MANQFYVDLGAGLNVGVEAPKVPAPDLRAGMRCVIKHDGTEVQLPKPLAMDTIETLIGAHGIGTVNLRRHGLVMIVDDMGAHRETPLNAKATALYHAICRPGTTWPIRGDVAIVPDEDFA